MPKLKPGELTAMQSKLVKNGPTDVEKFVVLSNEFSEYMGDYRYSIQNKNEPNSHTVDNLHALSRLLDGCFQNLNANEPSQTILSIMGRDKAIELFGEMFNYDVFVLQANSMSLSAHMLDIDNTLLTDDFFAGFKESTKDIKDDSRIRAVLEHMIEYKFVIPARLSAAAAKLEVAPKASGPKTPEA